MCLMGLYLKFSGFNLTSFSMFRSLILPSFFCVLSACGLDFSKVYFDSLTIEEMPLVNAVERVNQIHASETSGDIEFQIIVESPLDMVQPVALTLRNVTLDLLLKVLLSGTNYHYVTAGNYVIIKAGGDTKADSPEEESFNGDQYICTVEVTNNSDTGIDLTSGGSSGSGFLCLINDVPFFVTNIHVVDAANALKEITVQTINNIAVELTDAFIAKDRDLIIFRHKLNSDLEYLELSEDVSNYSPNHPIFLLGNTLGSGVIRKSEGTLSGIGAQLVEVNLSAFRGNSGGPILDSVSKKVLAVITKAEIVPGDKFTELARAKLGSPITEELRTFGTRIDTVTSSNWQRVNWSTWKENKKLIYRHVNGLLALNSLVSGNFKPGVLFTNESFLVKDEGLWRAYRRCVENYKIALSTKNNVLRNKCLKDFMSYVESEFRPQGYRWQELDNIRGGWYPWFYSSNSMDFRRVETIKKYYRILHSEWVDLTLMWETN